MNSKPLVCFLSWSIRGDSWQRATVIDALDAVALPRYESQRLGRLLCKHVRGATIVCAQRGHRPQYAIVRGIADVAGLRAGHVEPLAWFRYDSAKRRYAPCVVRSERESVLRAIKAFNDEQQSNTASSRELGVSLARHLARRFPLITARNGGGLYAARLNDADVSYLLNVRKKLNTQTAHAFSLYLISVERTSVGTLIEYVHDCTLSLFASAMKMRAHEERTQRRTASLRLVRARFDALVSVWDAAQLLAKYNDVRVTSMKTTDTMIAQLARVLGKV